MIDFIRNTPQEIIWGAFSVEIRSPLAEISQKIDIPWRLIVHMQNRCPLSTVLHTVKYHVRENIKINVL